jgi:hypothetical protein
MIAVVALLVLPMLLFLKETAPALRGRISVRNEPAQ